MKRHLSALALAGVLAMGCGKSAQANLTLSATARGSSAAAAATSATSLDLGNGIALTRIRAVVRKLKLENEAASDLAGDGGATKSGQHSADDDGITEVEHEQDDLEHEVVVGPVLLDLSAATLATGIQQAVTQLVPAGTYDELKLVVGPVSAAQAGSDAGLAALAAQNASLVIDGTIDGAPFSFASGLVVEVDMEGQFVVSDTASNNVTVAIDPTTWFGGSGSARLDPTDAAHKSAIEAAIQSSLRAFDDDDADGHDDHGGHDGADDQP